MGRKRNKSQPFVMIFNDMLKSEAWEELTNAARVAYVHLKSKRVSRNQEEVTLSFYEMERFMSRHTYSSAIDQLEECGFIVKTQIGGLYRRRNVYCFSEGWRSYKKMEGNKLNSGAVLTPSVVQF